MDDKLKYPNYGAMVRAQPPVLQTVGQGVKPVADVTKRAFPSTVAVGQGAQDSMVGQSLPRQAGGAVRAAPALALGVGSDVLRSAGLASRAVFGPYTNAAAEFGRGFVGASDVKPAPQATSVLTTPIRDGVPGAQGRRVLDTSAPLSELNALPGLSAQRDFSSAKIVPTNFAAASAGSSTPGGPTSGGAEGTADQRQTIKVEKQANGVLSFTGVGNGGTGVQYTGLPNFTTQQGGAGKGYVGAGFNLAEQNARMAAALQGFRDFDRQKQFDESIQNVVSGKGGPVGVAQNKIALASLGDLVQRQMANENATSVATINANTQKRGQDLGLKGDLARVGASIYGVDVGAATADKGFEVEKQKAAAAIEAAQAKARTGKAMTAKDQTALFVFAGLNADGTPRTPAQQAEVERRYASSFGNRDSLASLMSAYQADE